MLKTDIIWPNHRRYKSRTEWEPIGFFSDCLCNATQFDLMLGFFSSSAISVLANGFATFLYNGGKMRLIINDILTENDKSAIAKGINTNVDLPCFDLSDIQNIYKTLTERDKHFFDCIAWLIRNDRIEIKIISPKNNVGISHTKSGVFYDGVNIVGFDGSCNFSRTALIDNIESLTVSCDWDGTIETAKINAMHEEFELIIQEKDRTVSYISVENITTQITKVIEDKSLTDLLESEYNILNKQAQQYTSASICRALERAKDRVEAIIETIRQGNKGKSIIVNSVPSFPYSSGPRDYQNQAFENWKSNKQKGLFAMATGTGKTITSLNCLLEIYKRCGYYKAIILVPTITLVNQWEIECKKFNFNNIVKVCSKFKWHDEIDSITLNEQLRGKDNKLSYIIISTYASFTKTAVFKALTVFPKTKLLLIADEAHNMGAKRIMELMDGIPYLRRIGLSATPERQFDDVANKVLQRFFGAEDKYTYEYSMKEAIDKGVLCRYYYYPHLVKLTATEMNEYAELSTKLAKFFNNDKFDEHNEILTALLLKRKRIIHKAHNKLKVFRQIIEERFQEKGNLKYTLVYVPEGVRPDNEEADYYDSFETMPNDDFSEHLIDEYSAVVRNVDSHITVRKFTAESKDRDSMLEGFAAGEIEVLTSMKCLDEGVDVPRSELAIFCASTGNPRQFIQRRGRILRTHKDKHIAIIHDLVVAPEVSSESESYSMERRLLENELKRVRNFSLLSENSDDTLKELDDITSYYNLSLF